MHYDVVIVGGADTETLSFGLLSSTGILLSGGSILPELGFTLPRLFNDSELLMRELTEFIAWGADDNKYPPGVKGLKMNRVYHWRAFGRMERFLEQK